MKKDETGRWISVVDFCAKYSRENLKLNDRTIRRLCKANEIPARLINTNWMIDLWRWEDLAEKFKSEKDEIEEISVEDSVVNEVGISIVGSRHVRKKIS